MRNTILIDEQRMSTKLRAARLKRKRKAVELGPRILLQMRRQEKLRSRLRKRSNGAAFDPESRFVRSNN